MEIIRQKKKLKVSQNVYVLFETTLRLLMSSNISLTGSVSINDNKLRRKIITHHFQILWKNNNSNLWK